MAAVLDEIGAYPVLLCGTPLCLYLRLNLKLLHLLVGRTLLLQPADIQCKRSCDPCHTRLPLRCSPFRVVYDPLVFSRVLGEYAVSDVNVRVATRA